MNAIGNRRQLRRNSPKPTRLEPRMVFDGAVVTDVVTVAKPDDTAITVAAVDTSVTTTAPAATTTAEKTATETNAAATSASEAKSAAETAAATVAADTTSSTAQIEQSARDAITTYLNGSDAIDKLFASFNGGQDQASAEWTARAADVVQQVKDGTYDLTITVLTSEQMSGAYAAFTAAGPDGSPTIFVNGDWWQSETDTTAKTRVLVEEYGHSFDARLNAGGDTAGDEGEAFSRAVLGLSSNVIDDARTTIENDHATISLDGHDYAVEQAKFTFINAYKTYLTPYVADKEQNRIEYIDEALGVTKIDDMISSSSFSGNDVVVQLTIGGQTYYGWVSRPIKDGGIVRGFYFWRDSSFTTMTAATNDGNTDGDRSTADNFSFVLVVDQAWFDAQAVTRTATVDGTTKNIKFVGSSSDRVDSALNSLLVPNSAPTAVADSKTILEDSGQTSGNVLTNDSDVNLDTLTVTGFTINGVAGTLNSGNTIAGVGTFSLASDGSYTFTPDANYSGTVPTITYTVSDGSTSSTATLSIAVTPVNDAPSGVDKTINTVEDTTYTFSSKDFALTDTLDNPANGLKSVIVTSLPANGTLYLNGVAVTAGQEVLAANLSKLTFTPTADYHGTVSFGFKVRDDGGTTNGGIDLDPTANTITLVVANANDAPTAVADTNTITENAATPNTVTGNVLSNDTDTDSTSGDTKAVKTIASTTASAAVTSGTTSADGTSITGLYGTLKIGADGTYTYTLDDTKAAVQALRTSSDTLTEVFSYTMADSGALTSSSTLTITIRGANDAPTAANDANVAKESIAGSGNYGVGDTTGFTASGNVLTNDGDVDSGDSKTVTGIGGTATGQTTGTVTYACSGFPSGLNSVSSAASFVSVYADLGSGSQLLAGVTVSYFNASGSVVEVRLSSSAAVDAYLANHSSINVTLNTSNKTFSGTITVSSVASSNTVNVSSVGGSIATGMTMSWSGGSATVTNVTYDGSGNATAVTFGGTAQSFTSATALTFSSAAGTTLTGRYGTLSLGSTGSYTYTPFANNNAINQGDTVSESFTYTMKDGSNATSSATLTITVLGSGSNDPTAVADTVTITENSPSVTVAATGVLANDASHSSGTLSVTAVKSASGTNGSLGSALTGQYGTLTLNADGSYTYNLDNSNATVDALRTTSDRLSDVFYYKLASTGTTGVSWASLTVTIQGANDAPVAANDGAIAAEQGGTGNAIAGVNPSGNVLTNDRDVDTGDTKTAALTSSATGSYGTLTLNANGSYSYALSNTNSSVQALNVGGTLTDTFTYRVTDTAGGFADATLTVTIQGANDAPVNILTGSAPTVAEGGSVAVGGLSVSDVDNGTLSVTLSVNSGTLDISTTTGLSTSGLGTDTVTLSGAKADINAALALLTYTGGADFNGVDTVTLTTTDGGGLKDIDTRDITVTPDNRTVTVTGTTVNEASPYIVYKVTGADGQKVTLALTGGTATLGTDLIDSLEYFDGTNWTAYTPGTYATIPTGGELLVRAPVVQDSTYEGAETVTLTATNKYGTPASNTGTITDNGSGAIYLEGNDTFTPSSSGDTGYPAYLDDDRAVSVNSIAVNEASPFAVFTVSGAAGQKLQLALVGGTATSGADFGAGLEYYDGNDWVAYTPGSDVTLTSATLLVRAAIVQDTTFEGQEAFSLAVTKSASGAVIYGTASIYDDGTGDIYVAGNHSGSPSAPGATGYPTSLDDDRSLSLNSPDANEASDYVVFTLSGDAGQTVTLQLVDQSAGGTVTGKANIDETQTLQVWDGITWVNYDTSKALPTFDASGKIYVRVDITAEQDLPYEGAETFLLRATLTGQSTVHSGTATIRDDGTGTIYAMVTDPADPDYGNPFKSVTTGLENDNDPQIASVTNGASSNTVTVTEGTAAVFTVDLTMAPASPTTFSLTLTDGTAALGADYTGVLTFSNGVTYDATAHTITVPAGVTSFTVTVPTVDDTQVESQESFVLTVGSTTATGRINDNDVSAEIASVTNGASSNTVTVTEGTAAVFTVDLTAAPSSPTTFALTLTDITATGGADYTGALIFSNGVTYNAATHTITVPAGVTSFTVTVPTVDDTQVEAQESFRLTVGSTTATGRIADNDVAEEKLPATPSAKVDVVIPKIEPVVTPAAAISMPPSVGFAPLVEPSQFEPFAETRGQHDLRVDKAIPEVSMQPSGAALHYTLPTDAFVHTDSNAQVQLAAMLLDGKELPNWLSFNGKKGEFIGTPPQGFRGELQIKVIARDDVGRQAETIVRIKVGERTDQLSSLPGKAGVTSQLRNNGLTAWKAKRDQLLQNAREAGKSNRQAQPAVKGKVA